MSHFIVVSTTSVHHRIVVSDIIYCTAQNSSVHFHILNKDTVVASNSIAHYAEVLEQYGFVRIHQSTLLNTAFLSSICKKGDRNFALLTTGEKLVVARGKKMEIVKMLKDASIEKKRYP